MNLTRILYAFSILTVLGSLILYAAFISPRTAENKLRPAADPDESGVLARTEADSSGADKNPDRTEADNSGADKNPDRTEADNSEADKNPDRTETDNSEADNTETGASEADKTETGASEADKTETGASEAPDATAGEAESASVALAKAMGNGWNLGNTMEATGTWFTPSVEAFESCWGAPKTSFDMIAGIKQAGFDTVRVPVAWSNLMSTDGNYTIDSGYFARVDEIVGYVLDNDMYCIVNIHWDGGWWEDFGSAEEHVRAEAMKKYRSMWTQIAEHYRDYSERLIFESANEELGDSTKGSFTESQNYQRVNEINQSFVDIVRASGGANASRFLLIAGYNTSIDKTTNILFKMPTDSIPDHLLISVHYYDPSTYCIADKSDNSWGYKGSWGSSSDISSMKTKLKKMTKFTDAGYGVIIGEYGVAHCTDDNQNVIKEGTAEFYQSMLEFSEEFGYCPILWDTPGNWYDRNNCKFYQSEIADIYKKE